MKKPALITIVLLLTVVMLSIVQTIMSNSLSTSGILLSKIQEENHFYKSENITLSEKLLAESSLTNLASKASELGFVENKSQFVLKSSLPLAIRQ